MCSSVRTCALIFTQFYGYSQLHNFCVVYSSAESGSETTTPSGQMLHRQLISSFERALPPTFEEAAADAILSAPPPPLEFADSPMGSGEASFRELLRPRGLSKSCGATDIERGAAIVARAQVYARSPSPDSPHASPTLALKSKPATNPRLQQYCLKVNEKLDKFEKYSAYIF